MQDLTNSVKVPSFRISSITRAAVYYVHCAFRLKQYERLQSRESLEHSTRWLHRRVHVYCTTVSHIFRTSDGYFIHWNAVEPSIYPNGNIFLEQSGANLHRASPRGHSKHPEAVEAPTSRVLTSNLIWTAAFLVAASTNRYLLMPYLDGPVGLFPKALSRFSPSHPNSLFLSAFR